MRKNTDNTEMKNLKPFQELFSCYYKHFLNFLNQGATLLSNKILSENFLMASLIRNVAEC